MIDGMSNTLGFAEVKAFQEYLRDSTSPAAAGTAPPATVAAVVAYGGSQRNSGHTEWVDSRSNQTGVTTTFTPNTKVNYTAAGVTYDVDFVTARQGRSTTQITYAAITSRSHHEQIVHVLLMDGSTRAVSENIALTVWRNLGSRADGQVLGDY